MAKRRRRRGKKNPEEKKKKSQLSELGKLAITAGVSAAAGAYASFKVTSHLQEKKEEERRRLQAEKDRIVQRMLEGGNNPAARDDVAEALHPRLDLDELLFDGEE